MQDEMSIFSMANYQRICREKAEAFEEGQRVPWTKLIDVNQPGQQFFINYKKLSMTGRAASTTQKTPDQVQEDKAVLIFFRKQI